MADAVTTNVLRGYEDAKSNYKTASEALAKARKLKRGKATMSKLEADLIASLEGVHRTQALARSVGAIT